MGLSLRTIALGLGLLATLLCSASGQQIIKLGFLAPYPETDSAVPVRLAQEWISALRIAIQVLKPDYADKFIVQPFVQNSNCDRQAGAEGARRLYRTGVAGIVGPACSEAAIGAAEWLSSQDNIVPLISFAATASVLSDRTRFSTFFRTVYPDNMQAKAIMNITESFNWTKLYVLYSEDAYGLGLQQDITDQAVVYNAQRTSATNRLPAIDVITIGVPVDAPAGGYGDYFKSLNPGSTTPIMFATSPRVAQKLWEDASDLGKLDYPWWYFGSDGATAFDLIGEGERYRQLAYNLQGEIGIAPYRGNFATNSPYHRFLDAWAKQSYSAFQGLLTFPRYPRFTEPRSYVPYLIDAVMAFYVAVDTLASQGAEITGQSVMQTLSASGFGFEGCSGMVAFQQGDRDLSREDAEYNFVSLSGTTWESLGEWKQAYNPPLFLSSDKIQRPGATNQQTEQPSLNITTQNGTTITETTGPGEVNASALAPDVAAVPTAPLPAAYTGQETDYGPVSSPAETTSTSHHSGSSTGVVAAIVVPVVLVVIIVGIGVFWYIRRKQQESSEFVRVLF